MIFVKDKDSFCNWLTAIRQHLELALALLKSRTPAGVKAIINEARSLIPDDSGRPFRPIPLSCENLGPRLAQFRNSLGTIEKRVIEELADILQSLDSDVASEIDVRITMFLSDDDPDALEDDDNIFLEAIIPWTKLWPFLFHESSNTHIQASDRLYRYIINNSIPSFEEANFLRVGLVWTDILISETTGFKLNEKIQSPTRLLPVEIPHIPPLKQDHYIEDGASSFISPQVCKLRSCIKNILGIIERVEKACINDASDTAMLLVELERRMHDSRLEALLEFGDRYLTYGESPQWNKYGPEHNSAMSCLDGVMRQIEKWTTQRMIQHEKLIKTRNGSLSTRMTDYELSLNTELLFWTKKEKMAAPIPFYRNTVASIGLFNDGGDWHEFHPFKPMCYLGHVVFVDDYFPYMELEHIDYVTWKMAFARQIAADIDINTQKMKGNFPKLLA